MLYKQADFLPNLAEEDCAPPTFPLPNQLNMPVDDHTFETNLSFCGFWGLGFLFCFLGILL